jgi:hypothetical protein
VVVLGYLLVVHPRCNPASLSVVFLRTLVGVAVSEA